jgi:hypothetical protein
MNIMESQQLNHTSQESICNTKRVHNTNPTDEMIIGVRDQVTKHVLTEIDNELTILFN